MAGSLYSGRIPGYWQGYKPDSAWGKCVSLIEWHRNFDSFPIFKYVKSYRHKFRNLLEFSEKLPGFVRILDVLSLTRFLLLPFLCLNPHRTYGPDGIQNYLLSLMIIDIMHVNTSTSTIRIE